jgi:hypothetical protein
VLHSSSGPFFKPCIHKVLIINYAGIFPILIGYLGIYISILPIDRTHTAFFTLTCWTADTMSDSVKPSQHWRFSLNLVFTRPIRCVRIFFIRAMVSVLWVGMYGRDIDVGGEIVYVVELLCQQRDTAAEPSLWFLRP